MHYMHVRFQSMSFVDMLNQSKCPDVSLSYASDAAGGGGGGGEGALRFE